MRAIANITVTYKHFVIIRIFRGRNINAMPTKEWHTDDIMIVFICVAC